MIGGYERLFDGRQATIDIFIARTEYILSCATYTEFRKPNVPKSQPGMLPNTIYIMHS
jgi:hypothetical protein